MAAPVDNSRKLLATADTIHDMWDGYRNINDGGISLAAIRAFLRAYLQTTNTPSAMCPAVLADDVAFTNYLKSCLAGNPASSVIPSDIEDQTINHFENRGDIPHAYTTLTYSAIAGGAVLPDTDVLHIVPDDAGDEKDLDAAQKRIVADFILRYIFHIPADTPIGFNSYFTFDMGMSGVGAIFTDHPNAIRLITPQNIADSADTSTKKMGLQDNVFDFIENAASNTYISDRNAFSPTYRLGLQNRAFNSADPYAFSYIIEGPGPDGSRITHSRSFGPAEKEGPPLDYLLKCNLDAAAGTDFRAAPLATTSLSLVTGMPDAMVADIVAKTARAQEAIFLDIKRDGDQSQVDAAKIADAALTSVVMVTGDRLCSLASRLKGQRCIYQSKHVLKIYRFMPYAQDPAAIEAYMAEQRVAEDARFLAAYMDFSSIINTAGFIDRLKAFNRQVFDAANAQAFPILKMKLNDMYAEICRFITTISTVIPAPPAATADPVGYLRAVFTHLATANIMKEFAVDISRTIAAGVAFDPTKEYSFLNYSYKQINTLTSSFNSTLNKLVTNPRPQRGPPTNWFDAVSAPDGYNTILENIRYSISNPSLLDIYSIKLNTAAAAATSAALVADELRRIAALAPPVPLAANPACQSGGDPAAVILRQNRIELFHDICARAATYVDSVFTRGYPLIVLQSMLNQIAKTGAAGAGASADLMFPLQTLIENTQQFINANDTLSAGIATFYAAHGLPAANQNIASVVNVGGLSHLIAHVNAAAGYSTDAVMSGLLGALNANASTFQLIDELSLSWDQGAAENGIDKNTGNISSILNGLYFTAMLESNVARIMLESRATDQQKLQALLSIGIPQETITTAAAAPVLPGLTPQQSVIQHILSTFSNNYATSLVAPTLVMLAIMNDIIEGNVTSSTSLYTSVFLASGTLPAAVRKQSWGDEISWGNLTNFFKGNITTVSSGQVSKPSLGLLAGGARRRKRRTIRKNGRSMRRRRATARR
jgi:hypothetical protein